MISGQREAIIHHLLRQNGAITVTEISMTCNCSLETARRDLRRMEERGELERTHGGAVPVEPTPPSRVRPNGTGMLEARVALTDRVEALVVTPSDTRLTRMLVDRCRRAGVPVIAEASKFPGARAVVAVDNYRAGYEVGQWVAQHLYQRGGDPVRILDVSYQLPNTEARSRGFADGMQELPAVQRRIVRVNGGGLRQEARRITADALAVHPDITVIFGVNDDSALGALDAYRAAGLDEDRLLLIAFGMEGQATRQLLEEQRPKIICVAMFPELVARACVDAAISAYQGSALPERIITPFAIVTHDNLHEFYDFDPKTGQWSIQWTRAERLPSAGPGYTLIGQGRKRPAPRRLGYVEVFSSHEWYQNIRRAMQAYTRDLGISLEVVDATSDMAQEVDALKRAIGHAAARFVHPHDTVIIDAGRTAAFLAEALRDKRDLTVITNSLRVLAELVDEGGITLVSSGGVVRRETQALVGPGAELAFKELRADKAFISITGVSLDFGLSNTNIQEASVKQAMLKAAREVILLADTTKIGVESLIKVAPIESVDRLITDSGISAHDRLMLTQRGVEVSIAEVGDR